MRRPIFFGGLEITEEAANSHFMLVGSTGSGKTLNIRMMMGSTLPAVLTEGSDCRGVVFDVKQDMLPILHGLLREALAKDMGKRWRDLKGDAYSKTRAEINERAGSKLITLNPFDSRCFEWDIARDVTDPETALQVATILIPEETGSTNRYFSDAARDLLAGAIVSLISSSDYKLPRPWGLSDLLYAMRSEARLRGVLGRTEEGRELIALHLDMERTTKNIISTARSFLVPLEVPATLWRNAGDSKRLISLDTFLKSNLILVLGNNQKALAAVQAINRVVFQRLTELILDQQESEARRTWFYLDEVRKLGKLEGLSDLMTNGRSKGACVVLGFQDIDGMRAVYGKEVAGEITSMPASFGILRVSGASTPQWASDIFGEQQAHEITTSESYSEADKSAPTSTSKNEHIREKRVYLSSEFRLIPNPRPGEVLKGIFFSPFVEDEDDRTPNTWIAEISPGEIQSHLHAKSDSYPDIEPWPLDVPKVLPLWTPEEKAMRFASTEPEKPTASTPSRTKRIVRGAGKGLRNA